MSEIYCYPAFSRDGLGNKLFCWARCAVYGDIHGIQMLSPTWIQIPLRSAIISRDKRSYRNIFISNKEYVSGIKKYCHLIKSRKIQVSNGHQLEKEVQSDIKGNRTLVFKGCGDKFDSLITKKNFIKQEILKILPKESSCKIESLQLQEKTIGLHVRRGDFRVAQNNDDFKKKGALQTPLSWYIEMLRLVRKIYGSQVEAVIASDGAESEIRPLLKEPNVRYLDRFNSIETILTLSKCSILLGSGGSSFSAWAVFLGDTASVVYPGQSLSWFGIPENYGGFSAALYPNSTGESELRRLMNL